MEGLTLECSTPDYISRLPPEILENVLSSPSLKACDLFNFGLVCHACYSILNAKSLWKLKFEQRWPNLVKRIIQCFAKSNGDSIDWKAVYKHRLLVKRLVKKRVDEISRGNYYEEDRYQLALNESAVFTFNEADSKAVAEEAGSVHDLGQVFVINELQEICGTGPMTDNLTQKYYAAKSLHCLKHDQLRAKMVNVLGCQGDFDLEESACLIAQWMQPQEEFTVEDIKYKLEEMTEETKSILHQQQPSHPIFSWDKSEKLVGLTCEEAKSRWSTADCRAVIHAVDTYIGLHFNICFGQYSHPSKSYIDRVVEERKAIPITLCLVVMGISRRLGVVLEPVSFPETFLLRWLEFPLRQGSNRYTYVDPFNGKFSISGEALCEDYVSRHPGAMQIAMDTVLNSCTKQEMISRMLRNLVSNWRHSLLHIEEKQTALRHVVELQCMTEPTNYHFGVLLVQLHIQLEVNIEHAMNMVQELMNIHPALSAALSDIPIRCEKMLRDLRQSDGKQGQPEVKRRADFQEVKFSVGLIIKHLRYGYTAVIASWDSTCLASEAWINQMGVDRLPEGRHQPFYHVWAADGTDRYVAQENVSLVPVPELLPIPKAARHFDRFNGFFYEPNSFLAADYPDDRQFCVEVTKCPH